MYQTIEDLLISRGEIGRIYKGELSLYLCGLFIKHQQRQILYTRILKKKKLDQEVLDPQTLIQKHSKYFTC